jgi:type I restriction enzyme S subunit
VQNLEKPGASFRERTGPAQVAGFPTRDDLDWMVQRRETKGPQRRIAAMLDKADAVRRKRRESLRLLDGFLRSAFLEMFGDPVRNEKGWAIAQLETIADIVSGVTKGRKLQDHVAQEVPYLRVANVQDGFLNLGEVKTIPATCSEIAKYRLEAGDIPLTEGGDPDRLGRGAIWRGEIDDCIHQNHIFRVRLHDGGFRPDYMSALLGSP